MSCSPPASGWAPAAAFGCLSARSTLSPCRRRSGGIRCTRTTRATPGSGKSPARSALGSRPSPGLPKSWRSRLSWRLAGGEEIQGDHPGELGGKGRVVDRVGGEARAVGDADDKGREHGGVAGPQHRVDIGAGLGDLRDDGSQEGGEQSAEFAAVDRAALVDLWVDAGYQDDCPEQRLMAAEYRGYFPDDGFDQGGRV